MTIGSKIWELRRAKRLSRRKVSLAGGFSTDSLRRWETGKQYPRVNELVRLAEVLGISLEEIVR